MRTIRVFVLRLLVDPAEAKVLRGALQAVPEGETMPFADEQALLALLWQEASRPADLPGDEAIGSETMHRTVDGL
jgi:hypothetical protein